MGETIHSFTAALHDASYWVKAIANYGYHSRPVHTATLLAFAVLATALFIRSYIRYRRGWVSLAIDKRWAEINRSNRGKRKASLPTFKSIRLGIRAFTLSGTHTALEYFRRDFWLTLQNFYLPSWATVFAAFSFLLVVVVWPDPPTHLKEFLDHPFGYLHAHLPEKGLEIPEKILEGLIAIVIALIIFVAEAVRSGKSFDEKRVLLKISNLWVLGLAITIVPLAYLYPPGTGITVVAIVAVMLATLYTFANVLRHILSPTAIARAERDFLRQRIRSLVTESAKQRIGNIILSEQLGEDKDIRLEMRLGRSWLPDKQSKYSFIDIGATGMLSDVNLTELGKLANNVNRRVGNLVHVTAPTFAAGTTGPSRQAPGAKKQLPVAGFLLRRFGEEPSTRDTLFTDGRPVMAIRRSVAMDDGFIAEIRSRARHALKFKDGEQPSSAFREEMKLTKDRFISAIKSGSLGEIEELRGTYLLMAEQFLLTLHEFGGGYSAEQARDEINSFVGGWSEVSWLRDDIRDLIDATDETNNLDVIRNVIYLPFAIASRAIRVGDQLLFQQFIGFASIIYILGSRRANQQIGQFMIERAWRYVVEAMKYSVESSLRGEDDED